MPDPFRMVVLGDSIPWGRGLQRKDKATAQLRQWLAARLGRPVTDETFAHSRAVIAPDELHDRQPPNPRGSPQPVSLHHGSGFARSESLDGRPRRV